MADIDFQKQEEKLEANITITINPEDYKDEMDKKLVEYRKKAKIPGFRPGKTPKGILLKMIGKDLKKEIIPDKLWEKLDQYLKENSIKTLSRPVLVNEPDEETFNNESSLTWKLRLGIQPDVKLDLEALSGIEKYNVKVDDKFLEESIQRMQKENGEFIDRKMVEKGNNEQALHTHWTELDNENNPLEGGIDQDAHFYYKDLDKKLAALFDDKKPKETFEIKLNDHASPGALKKILKIEEEAAKDLHDNFRITVNRVFVKEPAKLDKKLFDQVFGEGVVDSEETFREKFKEQLEGYFSERSDQEFFERTRQKLLETHSFELPETLLWENFLKDQKEKKEEDLKKEFPKLLDYARWSIIADRLVSHFKIEIANEEIVNQGKADLQQLIQGYYGFAPDPDSEEFNNALVKYIQSEENYNKAHSKARDTKIFNALKEDITPATKEINATEFEKIEEETFSKIRQESQTTA